MQHEHEPPHPPLVITLDGPAGAGKSTMARALARELGYLILDTGALYRATAIHLMQQGVDPASETVPPDALESLVLRVEPSVGSMRVFLGDEDVSETIRSESVSQAASRFSTRPEVRRRLLDLQRNIARDGGVVAEGRDMGTVVFPDADLKFFITADLVERAARRLKELVQRGGHVSLEQVTAEMRERDLRDRSRPEAPLVKPADAVTVDTTGLSQEEVLALLLDHVHSRFPWMKYSGTESTSH